MIVEVAYATPRNQVIAEVEVPEGCSARQAALSSGLDAQFDDLDLAQVPLGVFGKKVDDDYTLSNGERVELYRPLLIDPKEARRARANKNR